MPHRLAAECHRLGEVSIGRQGERAADDLRPDRVELAHGLVHERPERRGIAHPPLDDLDESPTSLAVSSAKAWQQRHRLADSVALGAWTGVRRLDYCVPVRTEGDGRAPPVLPSVSHKGTTIGRRRGLRHPSRARVAFPGTRRAVTAGRRHRGTGVPRHPGPALSGRRADHGERTRQHRRWKRDQRQHREHRRSQTGRTWQSGDEAGELMRAFTKPSQGTMRWVT